MNVSFRCYFKMEGVGGLLLLNRHFLLKLQKSKYFYILHCALFFKKIYHYFISQDDVWRGVTTDPSAELHEHPGQTVVCLQLCCHFHHCRGWSPTGQETHGHVQYWGKYFHFIYYIWNCCKFWYLCGVILA